MRKLVVLVAAAAALVAPAVAAAHPLGNFTVNRFSRIDVSGPRIYVRYVLDLAEIPTYQAGRIDARAYARRIAAGARLRVDGARVTLVPVAQALAHPKGAGGLPTTRLEVILAGPLLDGRSRVDYRDTSFSGRIGWKEVVVGNARSASDELRAYPKSELESPLDVTTASAALEPGAGPDRPPALSSAASLQAPDRTYDAGFAALIGRGEASWLVILASLGVAMFWGAAHALSPGHGKAIVTAYLVGQRGTPRHAALLGAITTFTHTAGVFALGGVTLLLSEFIVPERLYPWINLVSGLLVVGIGASVFRSRYRHRRAHRLGHDHHHHHETEAPGWRGLVAVGVSGGLLPCPSALVVLLAAISLHRVAFGMLLIVAFSIGLAAAITGVGLVAVLAKQLFRRASFEGRLVSLLPALSALVILVAGVAMTARALPKVGI